MFLEQPKDGRYAKNAAAVFNLSYHIVWCPKYRRKVLVGDVEQRLKHILYARAQQYGVLIETIEVMPRSPVCVVGPNQVRGRNRQPPEGSQQSNTQG